MTKTIYTLANGTRVSTMAEALASGMKYRVTYEPVAKEPIKLSEKRKAMRVKAEVQRYES